MRLAVVGLGLLATVPWAAADEARIVTDIKAFFESPDLDRRAELARGIQADPAYDRAKVRDYLQRVGLFGNLEPGRMNITVPVPSGGAHRVGLRIPEAYSPNRKYPLIYTLHGGGGNGAMSIRHVEGMLGDEVERYIVAGPTNYGQPDFQPYYTPAVLLAIKKLARIDSDRVYVTGYSAGGCTSWAHAVLEPDVFAAVIPIAGTLFIGEQTDDFLPNIANTYVLNVWGARDSLYGWGGKEAGGIADGNRRMCATVKELELPVDSFEDPAKGHGGVQPPPARLASTLSRRRVQYPRRVHHLFQHACQARAYWLERNTQQGEVHPGVPTPLDPRPGEDPNRALERALHEQQGELRGEIDGQTITVTTKNVECLTVWIGDGMIDWRQDARVVVEGVEVFKGRLKPDLFVCLAQAARTYDFDRLRWSGLIVQGTAPARIVTGRAEFPAPRPPE